MKQLRRTVKAERLIQIFHLGNRAMDSPIKHLLDNRADVVLVYRPHERYHAAFYNDISLLEAVKTALIPKPGIPHLT